VHLRGEGHGHEAAHARVAPRGDKHAAVRRGGGRRGRHVRQRQHLRALEQLSPAPVPYPTLTLPPYTPSAPAQRQHLRAPKRTGDLAGTTTCHTCTHSSRQPRVQPAAPDGMRLFRQLGPSSCSSCATHRLHSAQQRPGSGPSQYAASVRAVPQQRRRSSS